MGLTTMLTLKDPNGDDGFTTDFGWQTDNCCTDLVTEYTYQFSLAQITHVNLLIGAQQGKQEV